MTEPVLERSSKGLDVTPVPSEFTPLKERMISQETCRKYGVTVNDKEYAFPYYSRDGRQHLANKFRNRFEKTFWSQGVIREAGLFGQQLFQANSAKAVTITEGEFDALAASEMQGNKYPVLSLKNGATGAVKDAQDNYEYLNSFETIVVCFDKDEPHVIKESIHYPGQEAALAFAALFPLGKVKILTLKDAKDANDYLKEGKTKQFISEWWNAPVYTPAGLRLGRDLWEDISKPRKHDTVPYPWDILNHQTYGLRLSELVLVTGDPGLGKTTLLKEIAYPIIVDYKKSAGFLFFEEPNADTGLGLMSINANKPLHLPDVREHVTPGELREYFRNTIDNDRVVIWDHFGSNSIHEVLAKIRHMSALGCKYIFLDHLSIIVSDQSGDERKQLDEISTKLKTLCMELNIAVVAAIHLNRGGSIRGSMGPEQLANIVIYLTRDHTSTDELRRNVTKLMVKKNRFSGRTGPSSYLQYDNPTGRLLELDKEQIAIYEAGSTE